MSVCVVDSSAIIAIAFNEPIAASVLRRISGYRNRVIGTPTAVETCIVHGCRRPAASETTMSDLFALLNVEMVDFSTAMQQRAWQAWLKYGKGRHRAALNYGDCMSYGVAAFLGAPLLFVGDDFSQTDIAVA